MGIASASAATPHVIMTGQCESVDSDTCSNLASAAGESFYAPYNNPTHPPGCFQRIRTPPHSYWVFNKATATGQCSSSYQCQCKSTDAPSSTPTESPSDAPTKAPINLPTKLPTATPTNEPTNAPTNAPTGGPTKAPTNSPTTVPPATPTNEPTNAPTNASTDGPCEDHTDCAAGEKCKGGYKVAKKCRAKKKNCKRFGTHSRKRWGCAVGESCGGGDPAEKWGFCL